MSKTPTPLRRAGDIGNGILRKMRAQTILRIFGTPFQRFFDRPGMTHRLITEKAVEILRSDGFSQSADYYKQWLPEIIRGNYRADALWMNATHHYNPKTKRGLWIWPGASDQMKNYFAKAVYYVERGSAERAMFTLGACLHLVQDCCQPYHANCVVLNGHQKYERWADEHKQDYVVNQGGLYKVSRKPEGWVAANAEAAYEYLTSVSSGTPEERDEATRVLLARAMRTSAGFLQFFWEDVLRPARSGIAKKTAAG